MAFEQVCWCGIGQGKLTSSYVAHKQPRVVAARSSTICQNSKLLWTSSLRHIACQSAIIQPLMEVLASHQEMCARRIRPSTVVESQYGHPT